jgi:glycosylphosphatidylinositol transamidase (GPIT) subunit GPI8
MSMNHDRLHQLALQAGYIENRYMYKLTSDKTIVDDKLRKYTELLIDDIFKNINDISKENGLVDNHMLREKILNLYKRE